MNPITKPIYSENDTFQQLLALKENRQKRSKLKQIFVEGVSCINSVLQHGYEVVSLVYAQTEQKSGWLRSILANSNAEYHYELPVELLAKLSDREEQSELLAIVKERKTKLSEIPVHNRLQVAVLDRPTNPGNLGSTLRSCNLLEVDAVIILGHAADIYDPKTLRSSIGTVFAQKIVTVPSFVELTEWIRQVKLQLHELKTIGTSAKADLTISQTDFTIPIILLFGNETSGLSMNLRNLCDSLVRIPTNGYASSLNLSCAISIFLYEAMRQRSQ